MYYEEKSINSVLMFRTTPDGCWKQLSPEEMSARIVRLEEDLATAKGRLSALEHSHDDWCEG